MFRLVIVFQWIESVMWPQSFSILSIFLSLLFPLLFPGGATLAVPTPSPDQLQYKEEGDATPQFLHH